MPAGRRVSQATGRQELGTLEWVLGRGQFSVPFSQSWRASPLVSCRDHFRDLPGFSPNPLRRASCRLPEKVVRPQVREWLRTGLPGPVRQTLGTRQ